MADNELIGGTGDPRERLSGFEISLSRGTLTTRTISYRAG